MKHVEDNAVAVDMTEIELQLLLDAIFHRYHYDFRTYSRASLRRRLGVAMARMHCRTLSQLQDRLLHDPEIFTQLLDYLTVQVSDLFRDPGYYKALREQVVPLLRTYPSLKVWIAGCATGEEVWSLAILFKEEGLLDRTLFYATDINPQALRKAQEGVYALDRIAGFTENHRRSGARSSLSDHYTAAYGAARFDPSLRAQVVFSDHSLATDSVFAEVHLVSCRNVLIYFERALQDRAISLFREALVHRGWLGLGARESLRFSSSAAAFEEVDRDQRVYRKRGDA